MSERRRLRNLFPGVPNPGGPDPDVTHAYPGLADELRAEREIEAPVEPERRDPATTSYPFTPDYEATPSGGLVKVQPLDEQGQPTGAPWREVGRTPEPPRFAYEPDGRVESVTVDLGDGNPTRHEVRDYTGDAQRGTFHLGPGEPLRDLSRDLPAATPDEVEAWRAEAPAHPVWGGDRKAVSDGTAPEGDEAEPARYRRADMVPERDPADAEASEHLGPEWRRVIDAEVDPVEVRLGCGCQIVIRSCGK